MLRHLALLLTLALLAMPLAAQETAPDPAPTDRTATGGAQTLEDILARQRGETVDDSFRRQFGNPDSAADPSAQLGTLGGASDPDLWRALRYDQADITVSSGGEVGRVLFQDGGMVWLDFRQNVLAPWGGWLLLGTIGALALFYLLRGRVRLDYPATGRTVTRFRAFERFSHWLLAGSFILLGLTGLAVLFGRWVILPTFGPEANAVILTGSKFIHNNVAWPFMLALVFVFFLWVWHNIPNRTDLVWIVQFGGIVGKKHPPAKKFNFGQKIIFWSVILLGGSISVSGLSLLFPFELPLFAKTFTVLNDLGINGWLDLPPFPTELSPQEEMQFAQAWHAIVGFVLMAIIIAHIYIGSLGMEGAYDAMGSGEVDEAWARQHHALWLNEVQARQDTQEAASARDATPAE